MIITVTLNPAIDKVLVLDSFNPNETNRIKRHFTCTGGKGTHVSMNLSLLGIRSIALGIAMGEAGQEIIGSLAAYNIDVQFIHLPAGNSRTNYVLLDTAGNCTILAEKGPILPEDAVSALLCRFRELVCKNDLVVISGNVHGKRGILLQDTLIDIAIKKKARVCLDTSGKNLARGVRQKPFLVKPNMSELRDLLDREPAAEKDIWAVLAHLSGLGIPNVIVSCGEKGSMAAAEGRYFRVSAPRVKAKNTVGCGDALLAGILAGLEQGLPVWANLRRAAAVAAAAAMTESTVGFDTGTAEKLLQDVRIAELEI